MLPISKLQVCACMLSASAAIGVGLYFYNTKSKSTAGENIKEAEAYRNLGNESFREGKYDEAIAFYSTAIEKCPKTDKKELAIYYQNRAAAYQKLEKWDNVKEDSTRSIGYNPQYAKAYFRRAKAHEALNDLKECIEDVTAACTLESFNNQTMTELVSRVLQKYGREEAEMLFKNQSPILPSPSFIRSFFRAYVAHPVIKLDLRIQNNSHQPHGLLAAKLALDTEQYENVISACTEEIENDRSKLLYKAHALLLRGTFHLMSGSFDAARNDFDAIIKKPKIGANLRTYALLERGSLNIQTGKQDIGMADFGAAEVLSPNCPDVYYQKAQAFILVDKLPFAVHELQRVINMVPNHYVAHVKKWFVAYTLAVVSDQRVFLDQAIRGFQNCMNKFPDKVECYSSMAQVLRSQKQFASADKMFADAITIEPDNATLHVQRGLIMMEWKLDFDKALEFFNLAIAVDHKCVAAYESIGEIEVTRGNLKEAVKMYDKAILFNRCFPQMCELCVLRSAAIAQINVDAKLGRGTQCISRL